MKIKKLTTYDNKIVRITTPENEVFEGICEHNSKDYNYHEFNRNEESLQMIYFMFYKRDIAKIEILDHFTNPYDYYEKMIVEDGLDAIEEILESEEPEHIYRLILYIKDHINTIDYYDELTISLKKHLAFDYEPRITNIINDLIKIICQIKCNSLLNTH